MSLKTLLKYRDNSYFNNTGLFLLDNNLERTYVSKVHLYNGNWYSNEGLKLKMTSIKCINCNELYHKEVVYSGTELKGVITKYRDPNSLGVNWNQGINIKKYGMPNYWNNSLNLQL